MRILPLLALMLSHQGLAVEEPGSRFGVSLGVLAPTVSVFRSQTGVLVFSVAGDIVIPHRRGRVVPSIELGIARVGGSQHVDTISVLAIARFHLSDETPIYGFVGIGGYRHAARRGHDSLNKIGGVLGLGHQLDQSWGLEVGYRISGSYLGANSDAAFLRARYRF